MLSHNSEIKSSLHYTFPEIFPYYLFLCYFINRISSRQKSWDFVLILPPIKALLDMKDIFIVML